MNPCFAHKWNITLFLEWENRKVSIYSKLKTKVLGGRFVWWPFQRSAIAYSQIISTKHLAKHIPLCKHMPLLHNDIADEVDFGSASLSNLVKGYKYQIRWQSSIHAKWCKQGYLAKNQCLQEYHKRFCHLTIPKVCQIQDEGPFSRLRLSTIYL